MSICLADARAAASRRNGAKSRGPKTSEGKARASQNALKHGLRAQKFAVVGDEDPAAFAALEAALIDELAPDGALQGLLAGRIARAAWRLERAERIEAELFARDMGRGDLGLVLVRDGHGARAFDTLLRYRGTALAELWRALRLLKALQAEPAPDSQAPASCKEPIEPEARRIPGETVPMPAADEHEANLPGQPGADDDAPGSAADEPAPRERPPARREDPIEPEVLRNPGETVCLPRASGSGRGDFPSPGKAAPESGAGTRPSDPSFAPDHADCRPLISGPPDSKRERAAAAARRIA